MLIRFLAFWENSFKENIGQLWRLDFDKLTSKDLWLNTWTGHYAVWLVENKTKKQNTCDQVMMFFSKNGYTPHSS